MILQVGVLGPCLKTDVRWMCWCVSIVKNSSYVRLVVFVTVAWLAVPSPPRTIIHLTLIRLNPPQHWLRLGKLTTKPQTVHPLTHLHTFLTEVFTVVHFRLLQGLKTDCILQQYTWVHTQHLFIKIHAPPLTYTVRQLAENNSFASSNSPSVQTYNLLHTAELCKAVL